MKFISSYSQSAFIIASFALLAMPRASIAETRTYNQMMLDRLHLFIQDNAQSDNNGGSITFTVPQTAKKTEPVVLKKSKNKAETETNESPEVRNFATPEALPASSSASQITSENDQVLVIGDEITTGENQDDIIISGNVEARHQGKRLNAERVIYNRQTGMVTAIGNVTIIDADGTSSFGDSVVVDDKLNSGVVDNFATRFTNGGVVASATAVKQDGGRNSLSRVKYTACPVCAKRPEPTWNIRARKATQDTQSKMISYQDVVFEVKGVPVLYTPYFSHGDPTAGRQSGLLQPKPGKSSRLGWHWEQPYLHVIDNYSDIVVSPLISQYVNPVIFTEYRRNFYSGKLKIEGSITKEKFFMRDGDKFGESDWRGHIFANGEFQINDIWNWGFGVENASDDYYLNRYSIHGQGQVRGPVRITGNKLIKQLYVEGKEDNFYSRIMAIGFQDLTSQSYRKNLPKVLPQIELHKLWDDAPLNGTYGLHFNAVYLDRKQDLRDSGRVSAAANWRGQTIISKGIVVKPSVEVKSDYFNYSSYKDTSGNEYDSKSISRFNAKAAVDFSLPLQKFTQNYRFVIEPKLNLKVATNNTKASDITLEDAINYENNYSSYFYDDVSAINDIYDNGASATFGVNLAVYDKNNRSINWFIGKQLRSKDNPYLSALTNMDSKNGDWVTSADISLGQNFQLGGNLRIDGETGDIIRSEVSTQFSYKNLSVRMRYHGISDKYATEYTNKELVTSAQYKLGKYTLFADNWHDVKNETTLRSRYGVMFGDECTDIRIYYDEDNTSYRYVTPTKSIKLQIAFKTLGAIDDDPFE